MSEFRKYGTDSKMDILVDSDDYEDRQNAARQNYGLEKLIKDKNPDVRKEVARQGYGLDILVNDPDWWVRKTVAEQGYGLEILVHDESSVVRQVVLEQGYGLNILINDKDEHIRKMVARQGYGLDILVNDKSFWVRAEVAKQSYGLDKLINDEHFDVRVAVASQGYGLNILANDKEYLVYSRVLDYLKEHDYKSIAEWTAANPDKVHKANPRDFKVWEDLKDFIYKIDETPKLKIESSYDNIDEFFDDCSSVSNDFDELIICTVDTKQPIIKIQKTVKEDKTDFKFIVDITTEDGDSFIIKTTIKSKEQLNSKIQETVESLRAQKEFNKYADDLEACL